MDIVLGVSMTSSTVRMVLVEGDKADGVTVDHDVFDVGSGDGVAASPADQVIAAIMGTQESAEDGGHSLKTVGVTWTDHVEAAKLRDELALRYIEDVLLISELHAAGALAQVVGRAVGYAKTALLLVNRDTATMSVVETDGGSIVKVDTQSLHSADAMAVFAAMAADVDSREPRPDGIFILGAGVDVAAVKAHIENLVSLPVHAPDEPELALARGAALAAAQAPRYEATTAGLAYSQDPEDTPEQAPEPAGSPGTVSALAFSAAATQMRSAHDPELADLELELASASEPLVTATPDGGNKSFLLAGSALGSIFVVGVVALVISLAVNIRPTVDERPQPGESVIVPSQVQEPPVAQEPAPQVDAPAEAAPETIQAPIPVAAPRTVYAEAAPAPVTQAPAAVVTPAPAAPAPVIETPAAVAPVPQVGAPPLWLPSPALLPQYLFPRLWEPDVPTYRPPTPTWRPPTPTYRPPTPTWRPPTPTWNPPDPDPPTWNPPEPDWPTWDPPEPDLPTWVPTQPQSPPTITTRPQTPIFTQQPQAPVVVPTVPQQPIIQIPQLPLFPQQTQQQSPVQQQQPSQGLWPGQSSSPSQGSQGSDSEWPLFPIWGDGD